MVASAHEHSTFSLGWDAAVRDYPKCPRSLAVPRITLLPAELTPLKKDLWSNGYSAWIGGNWFGKRPPKNFKR